MFWFQSTFPRGERPEWAKREFEEYQVSIHVPTRGTTITSPARANRNLFQSTFPRGERRCKESDWAKLTLGFNPRSHEGNDNTWPRKSNDLQVSIHVPTRGTTKWWYGYPVSEIVSIHVPTRGTTVLHLDYNIMILVSIHVPTRGTTCTPLHSDGVSPRFQSTFPRGERHTALRRSQRS